MKQHNVYSNTPKPKDMSLTAKEFVNTFYQPLGYLQCKASSDDMWTHAKAEALRVCEIVLKELPMYTGTLNPAWKRWNDLKDAITKLP